MRVFPKVDSGSTRFDRPMLFAVVVFDIAWSGAVVTGYGMVQGLDLSTSLYAGWANISGPIS